MFRVLAAICLLFPPAVQAAQDKVIVGVNIRGYGGVNEPQQDAKIAQLQGYGVKTIREGFPRS
jgi:hypothetical protein